MKILEYFNEDQKHAAVVYDENNGHVQQFISKQEAIGESILCYGIAFSAKGRWYAVYPHGESELHFRHPDGIVNLAEPGVKLKHKAQLGVFRKFEIFAGDRLAFSIRYTVNMLTYLKWASIEDMQDVQLCDAFEFLSDAFLLPTWKHMSIERWSKGFEIHT